MIPEAEAEGAKARVLGWKQQLKKRLASVEPYSSYFFIKCRNDR